MCREDEVAHLTVSEIQTAIKRMHRGCFYFPPAKRNAIGCILVQKSLPRADGYPRCKVGKMRLEIYAHHLPFLLHPAYKYIQRGVLQLSHRCHNKVRHSLLTRL